MCGIAGFWSEQGVDPPLPARMAKSLAHRGPDYIGIWSDERSKLSLVHSRLAILDLSPAGHQPMVSTCSRYVVSFNGEIYNHLDLRRELESAGTAPPWRGHSDTEILLACIAAMGLERTLQRLVGMFAFALWDRQERWIHLVRDRMGEKPLYYGFVRSTFAFASELKAFRQLPGWDKSINRAALALYMRHSTVPAPHSIYEGVCKLPAGCSLLIPETDLQRRRLPAPRPYWRLLDAARERIIKPRQFESDSCAVDALELVLKRAVSGQMIADVPLGAFLSGGIDSSTIVALMQTQSRRPVRTFSIGFREAGYDEAQHARVVAKHLGTEHTEMYVTAQDAQAVIPRLPKIYCEPFADSSQIPTVLISELARHHVTVSLSGDGGDELFGGYARYRLANRVWTTISRLPGVARRGMSRALRSLPVEGWNLLSPLIRPFMPSGDRSILVGDKVHKGAELLVADSDTYFYWQGFASHWIPANVVLHAEEPDNGLLTELDFMGSLSEKMMAFDAVTYLADDILVKVDRAAMSVSLETRVPLLDHRVVELAWELPLSMKIRDGQGKWILRQLLYRYVPKHLIERPKMGFGVPIDLWLRGPLRDWAETLLSETRLRDEGYLNPKPIRRKWNEHLAGGRNWQYHLWDVLMFQAWLEENKRC